MAHVPAEQRRQELIAAAFRVMAQVGVSAASTRAISAEAGVPQSAFHYCFRSKEELLRELTHVVVTDMVDTALAALTPGANLEHDLKAGLTNLWTQATAEPERQLVLYELTTATMRDPNSADLARWQYEQYFLAAERFITGLAEAARIQWTQPIPVLSRMLATMIDGLILNWLADRNTAQAEATLDAFATLFAGLTTKTAVAVGH
ncbi:TetR/AcrR family transcriptional regulator [Nocardia brasiliensis]|uniref:TetR/AcrR family transcriptional regulator n=1 Tax=Nocardia brasiliensis TaxID=37326 RepID=UPI0024589536|nr:TetR family transcriptional regulator [Nocardia brasiliensis]